ncbi:4851_t:CDS:2 [Paraglomus brasilianum]|uniref:4851_t:CDS:1 n=1 Tax=Paraglomus brasilianum TaxID=144538 RepID=A0A9N9AH42_9GLOM|nr:4851_t:CDS:2 [Paraglomus brasilianum]
MLEVQEKRYLQSLIKLKEEPDDQMIMIVVNVVGRVLRSARRNAELVVKTQGLLKMLQREDGGEDWCIETYRANQVEVMRLSRNMKQAYENLKRA